MRKYIKLSRRSKWLAIAISTVALLAVVGIALAAGAVCGRSFQHG